MSKYQKEQCLTENHTEKFVCDFLPAKSTTDSKVLFLLIPLLMTSLLAEANFMTIIFNASFPKLGHLFCHTANFYNLLPVPEIPTERKSKILDGLFTVVSEDLPIYF